MASCRNTTNEARLVLTQRQLIVQPIVVSDRYSLQNMDLEQQRILVQRSQTDIGAFGELYDEFYPRIVNYVLRRTASIDIAQEVTSVVFFKALENIGRFEWRGLPFSAWLYRIASNEIANHYRGNGHKEYHLDEARCLKAVAFGFHADEVTDVEANLLKHEEFLSLHEQLSQLPMRYQEVITLRFFEEKQISEISQILGKPEGTVKSLLHRGLEKLRGRMT